MHSLGFTGTRRGMTADQRSVVIKFLREHMPYVVHHGDCLGADAEFAGIVWRQFNAIRVVRHPPLDPRYRAYTDYNETMEPLPYLQRDANIVQASDHLLATPHQSTMPTNLRGEGTWWTINYAEHRIPRTIILPDGNLFVTDSVTK